MNIRFTAEIVPDGQDFAIKLEIANIPTLSQAQEIGSSLNDAIRAYFDAKGANLVRETGASGPRVLLS